MALEHKIPKEASFSSIVGGLESDCTKIKDDKRIEEENKKYMEDLLKSFKDKNDE